MTNGQAKRAEWQEELVLVRDLVTRGMHRYSAMGIDPTLAVVELKPVFCTNLYVMTRKAFEDRFKRESPVIGYEIVWIE